MANAKPKAREILEKLMKKCLVGSLPKDIPDTYKALSTLKSELLVRLPKEKKIPTFPWKDANEQMYNWKHSGYNESLAKVIEIVEEFFR